MTITTYHDDCLTVLPALAPGSVQALITSPPFYGLRAYTIPPSVWPEVSYAPMPGLAPLTIAPMVCQLGAEPTPEAYTAHLVHVMRLARAALRSDSTAWLNFGDSYAMDSKWGGASGHKNSNSIQMPRDRQTTGMGDKQLLGIPWRVAFALQADGWVLRSDVIWAKSNCMPESVRDRPTRAHEYIFLFGKSKSYYYDSTAVAEGTARPGTVSVRSFKYNEQNADPKGGGVRGDGGLADRITPESRNLRSVWQIPTTPSSFADGCPACYGTGVDRLALRGAHDRPRDTDAWRAWAAEQPKCAECQGSGRVGEDHFAVWPPALVEIMIKASTAARACAVCGAAWGRVVERAEPSYWEQRKSHDYNGRKTGAAPNDNYKSISRGRPENSGVGYSSAVTTGFAPRCACADDGSGRSVVLDPFAGSGTTLAVAERLGRDSIGIDLGYEQARAKRLGAVQTSMEALL